MTTAARPIACALATLLPVAAHEQKLGCRQPRSTHPGCGARSNNDGQLLFGLSATF